MPTAAVNGIQIYYADSDGEGPAVAGTITSGAAHHVLLAAGRTAAAAQIAEMAGKARPTPRTTTPPGASNRACMSYLPGTVRARPGIGRPPTCK